MMWVRSPRARRNQGQGLADQNDNVIRKLAWEPIDHDVVNRHTSGDIRHRRGGARAESPDADQTSVLSPTPSATGSIVTGMSSCSRIILTRAELKSASGNEKDQRLNTNG